jgi:hypothetical protein
MANRKGVIRRPVKCISGQLKRLNFRIGKID